MVQATPNLQHSTSSHMTGALAAAPDLALIHKLTNINDVNRLLHETVAKERSIDIELDRVLSKRAELERSFLLLNAPTIEMLELVHADCEQLLASASSTAELATHISSKVRTLDTVQTAVTGALSKISLILDCSAAVAGVKSAMDMEDYEAAAHHIATFTELDARLAAGHRASADGSGIASEVDGVSADAGQAESQRQILLDAKQRLEVVVSKQFEEAVAKRDEASAVRFAKLYKPLGKQAEGLRKYVEFIQLVVGAKVRSHLQLVAQHADEGKKLDWAAALGLIFKTIVEALESHEHIVSETFGGAAVLDLVAGLQAECDTAGSRIVSRFMEVRKVAALVKEATARRGSGREPGLGVGQGGLDHRQLEQAINELLGLCRVTEEYNQHVQLQYLRMIPEIASRHDTRHPIQSHHITSTQYMQFMLGRMRQAAGGSLTATRETSFRSGGLNVGIRELLGHYMALEAMYMYETVAMAIRIDQVSPGSLSSSMVDDVFLILRKVGLRVLKTGNVQVMCGLLMELSDVAGSNLRTALAQRLVPGPNRLLAAAPLEGGGVPEDMSADLSSLPQAAADYAVALNNSDLAAEYMAKLKAELEGYIDKLFPSTGATGQGVSGTSDRERMRGLMQELHKTAGELRQAASKAVEQLAEGVLPRLRPALDQAAGASYAMGEEQYSAAEVSGGTSWVPPLLLATRTSLAWLKPIMTPTNYEGCVSAVLDKLVSRLEALLSRKNFSQLGGLALERDLRTVVSHMSELTSRSIRDKFARLNQMALVLGLESIDELKEYWGGDAAITWRLTGAEVKSIMALRPDVPRDALSNLMLA